MYTDLQQQNFPYPNEPPAVFSSDPTGVKERPADGYYSGGVNVGYTAPAKWWNWLWNHISAWLKDSKADREAVNAELLNALSTGDITPDSADAHQLSRAVEAIAYSAPEAYDNEEITEEIDGVMVTHKVNQPYVVGYTLYIPETELL